MPSVDLEECCVELNLPQPLLGSAPESTALVVIDCPKPWNSKVQASSGFPADWLEALEEDEPFFLWFQPMDTHPPYRPRAPFRGTWADY